MATILDMDEIIIEEKKYISSKQAAKATGYAKDYVGQLCREGRVPARLVGRSWYVLESAIRDHRFGAAQVEPEEVAEEQHERLPLHQTWESPRYEAVTTETLPSVNMLQEDTELQDSWKTWFDHAVDIEATPKVVEPPLGSVEASSTIVAQEEPKKETEESTVVANERVDVPIHVMRSYVQKPFTKEEAPIERTEEPRQGRQSAFVPSKMLVRSVQIVGILIAAMTTALALLGSGYLDGYAGTSSQVGILSGVTTYNK